MTFESVAVFKCDGCKVSQSDPIFIKVDIMQARPPRNWLRVQVNKLTASPGTPDDEALDQLGIKFYCPHCAPLIESYLAGRRDEETPQPEPDRDEDSTVDHYRQSLRRWHRKACVGLGIDEVRKIIAAELEGTQDGRATH